MKRNLDETLWQTDTYLDLLGLPVVLRSNAPELTTRIERLMRSFAIRAFAPETTALTLSIDLDDATRVYPVYVLYRDETFIGETPDAAHLFRLIEWQLDIFIAEAVSDVYLLHAGAVARNGIGVILPGASGHGKSSLTMGLMLRGCSYLSDELGVVDPATAQVHPFPKPFSIKNRAIFGHLADHDPLWFGPNEATSNMAKAQSPGYLPVWYIHPEDAIPHVVSEPVALRYIVFPTYDANARFQLAPMSPGDAMQHLIENSINLPLLRQRGFRLLAQLVRQSSCYTLTFDNLEAGVTAIMALLDSGTA